MSNPDDPEKKPKPTVAWDPDEEPGPGEAAGAPPDRESAGGDPLVGQLIRDKWEVLERLGAGSYGTVYRVRDVTGGWIEALKILAVDRISGDEADTVRKRFLREARIMKRLGNESPHIVGLSTYEEDLEEGLVYFLMEFVEGRDLRDVLAEDGPLEVERALSIGLQVCEALIVAHEGPEPVVHRDLKLENLMLAEDRSGAEIVKVLDFGIAKIAESDPDSRLTTVGTLGTPGYAAPEQVRAEEVDGRTDLFAVGVILYALLTGRDPWLGHPAHEPTHRIYDLMSASERGAATPMAETGTEVPAAVEGVVFRLLRRDPDRRFQSARALREVLRRLVVGGAPPEGGIVRVLSAEPGVEVEVRSGRRSVARGPTPCLAEGLEPGTYRVRVRDPRYEEVETTVEVGTGGLEDVTVPARPRSKVPGPGTLRQAASAVGVAILAFLVLALLFLRPWGRTVELSRFTQRAAGGEISRVRVAAGGVEGRVELAFMTIPVRAPVEEEHLPAAVDSLRSAGVAVETTWAVDRLIERAARAQRALRYFGGSGATVRDYASRALELDPDSDEARALLRKVAERMAWDADAALLEGSEDRARALVRECLALVDGYPRCTALSERL